MLDNFSILAVDDEPFNLDLIEAAFLEYTNVKITNAINAKEALELLEQQKFDVLLLDICMPSMDGIEALKIIKQNPKLKLLPILMVTANTERESEALKLGASDFIGKPYDIEVLCARTLNYAKLNRYHEQIINQTEILEEQVKLRTMELQDALTLSKETEYEISFRLGRASEFRDLETGGHIKRMSHYSELLARLYGLDKEECELVLYAAPLHDIGKVGIPDKILLKPGRFEPHEFEIMKQHSVIGAKMLEGAERFPVINAGRIIALQHHEKWDGSGYPSGLSGKDIHLYARIIAIADVFDALSSKRCYKEAMELDKVLDIMKKDSGTHFDPLLITLFLNNLDEFLKIKEKYLDEEFTDYDIKSLEQRQ
ncbi:MAG: response regulator [Sulfurimonas sp.]|nr:response regulator [Sulfurimonas sp.]